MSHSDVMTHYRQRVAQQGLAIDPAQQQAIEKLAPFINQKGRQTGRAKQGIYLWGPVGRGKTLLMDLCFDTATTPRKLRLHFHRFMQRIHADMARHSGTSDPLRLIARQIASEAQLLCFDEFYVLDIADAMILGRLLRVLFEEGTQILITSNTPPPALYQDGLQRQRFESTIALLEQQLEIVYLDGGQDHRLRHACGSQRFMIAAAGQPPPDLADAFQQLTRHNSSNSDDLIVSNRKLPCNGHSDGIAWFRFEHLCEGPRSQQDYIALSQRFHTVLVSHIPRFGDDSEAHWVAQGTEDCPANATNRRRVTSSSADPIRRLIALVDEFYDRGVKLILSLQAPLDELYCEGALREAFERTQSRLYEMQTDNYWSRPHCP